MEDKLIHCFVVLVYSLKAAINMSNIDCSKTEI